MAQYQTFPGATGASRTVDKLKALILPDLRGRSFLDVGCNEGFFCGFAKFSGAERSVGLDQSKLFIDRARLRFPDCEFLLQGWDRLPDGTFDVILLASALHYAEDQPELLRRLVGKLSADGVLVVELGIVSSLESEWVKVDRGIDQRAFPSMRKLREVLAGYAWKWMGPSVMQQGDPVARHVIHISKRKPIAYLLMQPPGYGKTSIASNLFMPAGVRILSGDEQLNGIAKGQRQVDEKLKQIVDEDFSPYRIDQLMQRIFESGAGPSLVESCVEQADGLDFALDMYVPAQHQDALEAVISGLGYLPIRLSWNRFGPSLMAGDAVSDLAHEFFSQLDVIDGIGPPVAAAVRGFVDEISFDAGRLVVRGWAVDAAGSLPGAFVVHVNGHETIVDAYDARAREDVKRHLGLADAKVGYCLSIEVPGISGVHEIGADFSVRSADGHGLRLNSRVEALLGRHDKQGQASYERD